MKKAEAAASRAENKEEAASLDRQHPRRTELQKLGGPTEQFCEGSRRSTFLLSFSAHFDHPRPPSTHQSTMAPKAKPVRAQENVQLGPQIREGELVFGVARIFASFNDTFVHVTDLS